MAKRDDLGKIIEPRMRDRWGAALRLRLGNLRLFPPVAGDLVRSFDPRQPLRPIAYDAPAGATVVAVADGLVASAGRDQSGWQSVSIAHIGGLEFGRLPALSTTCAGLGAVSVRRGDRVTAGQAIGRLPAAGEAPDGGMPSLRPTPGFLEFSMSRGQIGKCIDPRPFGLGGR
jgi:septal ring factor EnvC (AmiA/AmiB activator)